VNDVAIIGSGSWGTALAIVLADNGLNVVVAGRNEQVVREMNEKHTNQKYLPDARLPLSIRATCSLEEAVGGCENIVMATPSHALVQSIRDVRQHLRQSARIIHATKGIDPESLLRPSEQLCRELHDVFHSRIACLSGPSHAEEVVKRCPTTVVVASRSHTVAEHFQSLFMNQYFRVYTNPDLVGVELGGALKNIIALGVGISDGLGFGDNARAALMTRGLAEIARLGDKLGASQVTFAGLSGIGDLIVTCTSKLSRNWTAGSMLGKGMSLSDVLNSMHMVVEGIRTTDAACRLATRHSVEMPITRSIYGVLFENRTARKAVEALMGRERTHEMEEVMQQLHPIWDLP